LFHNDVAWRTMTAHDLPAVERIAAEVHPDFYEAPEVLAERHRLYREGCHLLEIAGRPAGYVLSHPWHEKTPPALNALLGGIPADADTYYLHDLALLPAARRVGAARQIVSALARHAVARGLATMSLIAVNGSVGFWETCGFSVREDPDLKNKLQSYDAEARLMARALA
jgi:GNAT superfamily N-acetyltransferase